MTKSSMITLRIDPKIKEDVENLYHSFGLSLSDALNMFIHQSLLVGGLPFELKKPVFKGEMAIDDPSSFHEEEIDFSLDDIKQIVKPIAEKYRLKSLYLMGSRARGDNRPDSDYDFCFEMDYPHSLLTECGLMMDLEGALHKEIDLLDRSVLKEEFVKELKKDGVLVYEN